MRRNNPLCRHNEIGVSRLLDPLLCLRDTSNSHSTHACGILVYFKCHMFKPVTVIVCHMFKPVTVIVHPAATVIDC